MTVTVGFGGSHVYTLLLPYIDSLPKKLQRLPCQTSIYPKCITPTSQTEQELQTIMHII